MLIHESPALMKIVMIISSLGPGGSEKVLSMISNYWAERGHDVAVVTIASRELDFFTLHSGVRRIALDLMNKSTSIIGGIHHNVRRVKQLRKELKDLAPDLVVSFVDITNILTVLAAIGLGLRVVICERSDPGVHSIGWFWHYLRKFGYPRASAIVVQSENVLGWARANFRKCRVVRIPNPIHGDTLARREVEKDVESAGSPQTVASLGRLGPEKGFDLLLRAFALSCDGISSWRLVIFGEGPERGLLEGLARELGIDHKVLLPGQIKDSLKALERVDLFVLSSRFEGFPNALLEAMACGLPVISFDCPSGPAEIIRNGEDGILVAPGDVGALASAMNHLMTHEGERKRLGEQARKVTERFSLERVMGLWEELLKNTVR